MEIRLNQFLSRCSGPLTNCHRLIEDNLCLQRGDYCEGRDNGRRIELSSTFPHFFATSVENTKKFIDGVADCVGDNCSISRGKSKKYMKRLKNKKKRSRKKKTLIRKRRSS